LVAPEVAAKWEEPSVLAEFTVAGLAGHLVRATTSVEAYLDRYEPDDATITPAEYYGAAVGEATSDPSSSLNQAIRRRGEETAAAGHAGLVESFAATLERLRGRLADEREDRRVQVYMGLVLTLDDYLVTRLIELLVHTDDLAVSVGIETPEPFTAAADAAVDTLVAVARRRHGDLAVLRALTRRERDPHNALRVL
jgi:uncharacterized protein (TIGR03083 family)